MREEEAAEFAVADAAQPPSSLCSLRAAQSLMWLLGAAFWQSLSLQGP